MLLFFMINRSQRFSITSKYTGELKNGNPEIELTSTGDFFQQLKMELDSNTAAIVDVKDDSDNIIGKQVHLEQMLN